ncbi:leucine-rich repeat domain-containing protein [Paenibacillus sp. TSA_86.1]|uniref:leucine-rich repeat domain-containing protein n=1 Tax=Paenibacillus sp. TSA_86.1 TaxID=3415649 RepID=UPI00404650AC
MSMDGMDITNAFTDEHFKQYILVNYCDQRGYIHAQDVSGIEILELPKVGMKNLQGIEYFTELKLLDCSYNALTSLNVEHNLKLETLLCRENQMVELLLHSNTELETLDCSFNRLRKLDFSRNQKLKSVECHWNLLSELNVSHLKPLERLACSYNTLFSLDTTNNDQLIHLDCANNDLTELDVAGCPALIELRCHHNHLKNLNLRSNQRLESVRCFHNHIRELQLIHNLELVELYCSENKLKSLDISHNSKLERIQYGDNLIVEPDHEVPGMGTFQYDNETTVYYLNMQDEGRELRVTAQISTKAGMDALSASFEAVWEEWPVLRERALHIIGKAHPDEDTSTLVLADAEFQADGSLKLGFDAGDTPAGQLYIYAEFDSGLQISNELIYETY